MLWAALMKIKIDEIQYKVTENLGFVHSRGQWAKAIKTPEGERIALRHTGSKVWKFAEPLIIFENRKTFG